MTLIEFESWLNVYVEPEIDSMPSLGLFKGIYEDKRLNSTTRWEMNDLHDMMFLSCGAGYADYVVAERSLTGYVSQAARRLRRTTRIFPCISDLFNQPALSNL